MPRLEVLPFADEHLEDASTLLAARHARHREAEPLLPSRYEATEPAREELTAVWNAEGVSGAIAFSNGKAVGYLIGAPRSAEEWGENVWVELAGHAVENAEDIRDLYAVAAAPWFDHGNRRHYVLVPGHDSALIDAWFRLGFGHQQGHGIRESRCGRKFESPRASRSASRARKTSTSSSRSTLRCRSTRACHPSSRRGRFSRSRRSRRSGARRWWEMKRNC